MPLFEIVLRFADRDEVRLTDRAVSDVGDRLTVGTRRYVVTGTEQPRAATAARRFVLEPVADDEPER